MRTTIIFRYLFRELVTPFLLGLTVFVFILVMSQILRLNELIIVYGVGLWSVIKLVFYLMISFLAISIPIAFLFSVIMLFGRLSSDSELTALKASGFSVFQLLMPVLLFSAGVCFFCLYLTLHLESWGARSSRALVFDIGKNKALVGVKEGVFNDDFFGLVLYTDKVDSKDKTLEHVFLYDERDRNRPVSVIADKGMILSSTDLPSVYLVLHGGSIHTFSKDHASVQKISFDRYTINLSIDEMLKVDTKEKPHWLPLEKLQKRISEEETKGNKKLALEFRVEYHRKFAVAFASLILAILGISLGIRPSRAARSLSFVYTIILVGIYWGLYINARHLATSGVLHPAFAMWSPNLIFTFLAGILLIRASRK